MATLQHPIAQTAAAPAVSVPYLVRRVLAWCLRPLQAAWRWACRHAERPGRVVPYY